MNKNGKIEKPKQLNIKSGRAYEAALELSKLTGENLTETVTQALEQRLDRIRASEERPGVAAALMELGRRYSALPDSGLSEDQILSYDENGLPT